MKPSEILPDGPHYDVKAHLAHVQKLWKKYPYRDGQVCAELAAALVVDTGTPDYIGEDLAALVAVLLEDNEIVITREPTLEYAPYLTRMQKRLTINHEPALTAIKRFLEELYRNLPKEESALTLPFADRFDPASFISTVYRHFYEVKSDGEYLFDDLREKLLRNLDIASGNPPQGGTKPIIRPDESKEAPHVIYSKYLAGTPFLSILDTPTPFNIPIRSFGEHGFLFAKSGHGKSQTMRSILSSLLNQDCAIFLLDGNGALIENIDKIASIKDRLVVLDPDETPALNFFTMRGASREKQMELFFYLFKAIDQGLTERQATMVAYLVDLMQAIPNATLDTLREVCETKTNLYPDALLTLPPVSRDFFNNVFYAPKLDALTGQTKQQITQRLYTIARNHTFNAMFSAPENKFNALELMQGKKVVVVDTSRDKLGDHGSAIFGRYILAQCLAAAWQRPKHRRHLCLIMVDEAKTYLDDQSKKILSDARAFGVGLLLASQFPDQLEDGVRKEVVNNTSVKFAGPAAYSVVAQLNRDMRCEADFILSMKKQDYAYAEWACYVDNLTPSAVRLKVPFGAIEKLPQMSDAEWRLLRVRNRERYGTTTPPAQGAVPSSLVTHEKVKVQQPQTSSKNPKQPKTSSPVTELDTDH